MNKAWYGLVALLALPVAVLLGAQGVKKLKNAVLDEADAPPAKANKVKPPKAQPVALPNEDEADKAAVKLAKDVDKLLEKFDRNGDGFLDETELPTKMHAEAARFDRDNDARLSRGELAALIRAIEEAKKAAKQAGGKPAKGKAPVEPPSNPTAPPAARPAVYRPGQMPAGLPDWFAKLDTDNDGQVGLYEWKAAGRDTDEFVKMDLNEDGLLTAEEALRVGRAGR